MSAGRGQQFLIPFLDACLRVFFVLLSKRLFGRDSSVEIGQGGEVAIFAFREEDLSKDLLIVEDLS